MRIPVRFDVDKTQDFMLGLRLSWQSISVALPLLEICIFFLLSKFSRKSFLEVHDFYLSVYDVFGINVIRNWNRNQYNRRTLLSKFWMTETLVFVFEDKKKWGYDRSLRNSGCHSN